MKMKNTVRILALLLGTVLLFSGCAGAEETSPRGTIDTPEKFRNYYAGHKDEIDAFIEKAGEVAKNIGEIGEKVWDKLKDIFEKASEK